MRVERQGAIALSVVGSVTLTDVEGEPVSLQPAQRQLLCLLVAAGPSGLSADRLADELWGEQLPPTWRASLRMALSRLRKKFGTDCLLSEAGTVRLVLDHERVDLWRFGSAEELTETELASLLDGTQVFPGIEPTRLLTAAARRVESLQREHLLGLLADDGMASRSLLARARAIAERDVLDAEVVACVVRLHHRAGLGGDAREVLASARDAWHEAFSVDLPEVLAQLEHDIGTGDASNLELHPPIRRPESVTLPGGLEMFSNRSLFGREALVDAATAQLEQARTGTTCGAVLLGASGAGKTHIAAGVSRQLAADGFEVLYAAAVPGAPAAYGPILSCLPELAEVVQDVMSDADDRLVRTRRASIWAASLLALQARADGRPIVLVIDDAQWLDSQSSMLVEFLLRSDMPSGLALLVLARGEGESVPVPRNAGLLNVADFEVSPLDSAALGAMLQELRPDLLPMVRSRAVARLMRLSGGLPGVARVLVPTVDEAGGVVLDRITEHERTAAADSVRHLSASARHLGQIAAVVGLEFSVDDVQQLSGFDEESTVDALDELLAEEAIIETHPDRFRFTHILIAEALRRSLSALRQRRLHRDAGMLCDDPHIRAHHLLGAESLVERSEVLSSVAASVEHHRSDGSFAEAAQALGQLDSLREAGLTLDEQITLAEVLSLAGSHERAEEVRRRAFERAASTGDWPAAVAAGLSGLPEAENPVGEPGRVRLLETAAVHPLPPDVAWALHSELARQAALVGKPAVAARSRDVVLGMAETSSQHAIALLAARGANPIEHPSKRLERIGEIDLEGLADDLQARIFQAKAIDLSELGLLDQARTAQDRAVELAHRTGDPVRVWHSLLFAAGEAFDQGDEEEFEERREAAYRHGVRHGIATADTAYLAQAFLRLWWRGEAAALAPLFPVDPTLPLLQQAAAIVVLGAAGEPEKAARFAVDVTDRVADDYIALPTAALLAELVGASGDRRAIQRCAELLEPRRGTGILVGAGFATMGPADRYLALLLQTEREREAAIDASCALADSWGVPAWSDPGAGRVFAR